MGAGVVVVAVVVVVVAVISQWIPLQSLLSPFQKGVLPYLEGHKRGTFVK